MEEQQAHLNMHDSIMRKNQERNSGCVKKIKFWEANGARTKTRA
jgi:hypothetical protein